jgi:hypothetical protein
MAKDELTTDDKFAMLIQALTQRQEQGISAETLKELLAGQAENMRAAEERENKRPPLHSSLAYPEGDRDKPRENILTKQVFLNGFPLHKFPEASHWWELELAEQVKPGTYRVIRKDGSDMTVEVKGETDPKGVLTKISIEHGISREEKNQIPPVPVLLYQLVYNDAPQKRFVEAMHLYLDLMVGAAA